MRAIIIEGWAILRHGLGVVVRQGRGDASVTEVTTATEGVASARGGPADLVVVGQVPDSAPADLVARLGEVVPDAKVVVLLDQASSLAVRAALAAGADAVLSRSADAEELIDAIVRVRRGERMLSTELIALLADVAVAPPGEERVPVAGLTRREREILAELVRGASNREIAAGLFIGEATVKTHLASIYDKLGVANRHQAVARYLELSALRSGSGSVPSPAVLAAD